MLAVAEFSRSFHRAAAFQQLPQSSGVPAATLLRRSSGEGGPGRVVSRSRVVDGATTFPWQKRRGRNGEGRDLEVAFVEKKQGRGQRWR